MPGNEATELLRAKPMQFMKTYAVSPPDGAGTRIYEDLTRTNLAGHHTFMEQVQKTSPIRDVWQDTKGIMSNTSSDKINTFAVTKGGVVHVSVIDMLRDKVGAKTFDISATPDSSRVPIHFLPWNSTSLVELRLPDAGADLDDPDNPNLFFTAALSGCSVFVDGHPRKPRVVHAGLTGKLSVSAKAFWEERFMDTMRLKGEPVDAHIRSIDKSMYSDTREAVLYKKWLKNEHDNVLTIREVKDWASVFGIRFGALWSFYLQNCATVTTIRLVKKADVTKTKSGNNTFYTHAPTGGNVEVSTVKSGVFGIRKSVYKVQQQYSRPLAIQEFYPNGPGGGNAIIRVPTEQLRLI